MKEQRKQILAAEAVEANLGEVEGTQSRFVDAGFVATGGRNVDYAGKFLNAVKGGVEVYQQTAEYKQKEANDESRAIVDANAFIQKKLNSDEFKGLDLEKHPGFFTQAIVDEQATLYADRRDDDLAKLYKTTYINIVKETFHKMSLNGIGKIFTKNKKASEELQTTALMGTPIAEITPTSINKFRTALESTHTDKEASKALVYSLSNALSTASDELIQKNYTYQENRASKIQEVLLEAKKSKLSSKEWLAQSTNDEGKPLTLNEVIEARLHSEGITNPAAEFDNFRTFVKEQQGTDGVGKLSYLYPSLQTALNSSKARILGVNQIQVFSSKAASGNVSLATEIASVNTGDASEDERVKKQMKASAVQSASTHFQLVVSDDERVTAETKKKSKIALENFLLLNPDQGKIMMSPIANEINARIVAAFDSNNPTIVSKEINDIYNDLWNTSVGSTTRAAILDASPDLKNVLAAFNAGLQSQDLIKIRNLSKVKITKEEFKDILGDDIFSKTQKAVSKKMPFASPDQKRNLVSLIMTYDYHNANLDKDTFMETYGEGMSYQTTGVDERDQLGSGVPITKALSDATGMIDHTLVPNSSTNWKRGVNGDVAKPGYIGGAFRLMFANGITPTAGDEDFSRLQTTMQQLIGKIKGRAYQGEGLPRSTELKDSEFFTMDFTNDNTKVTVDASGDAAWDITVKTNKGGFTFTMDEADIGTMFDNYENHIGKMSVATQQQHQEFVKEVTKRHKESSKLKTKQKEAGAINRADHFLYDKQFWKYENAAGVVFYVDKEDKEMIGAASGVEGFIQHPMNSTDREKYRNTLINQFTSEGNKPTDELINP